MSDTTTALATAQPQGLAPRQDRAAFEPANLSEALHLAQVLVASRLLPRAIATPEAAFVLIATGRELGLSALQSCRMIHVIDGKASLSADLMVALVKTSPVCVFFRLVESSALAAVYETQRRGEPSPTKMGFTADEAQRAQLLGKDNWKKYPAAMLRARAAAALARAVYPDLVGGVYDPDELGAPEPAREVRDVTPAPVAVPAAVVRDDGRGGAAGAAEREATKPAPAATPPVCRTEGYDAIAEAIASAPDAARLDLCGQAIAETETAGALMTGEADLLLAALADRRAEVLVRAQPPAPVESPEYVRLATALRSAAGSTTALALSDVASEIRAAHAAHRITDAEREALRGVLSECRRAPAPQVAP